MSNSNSDKNEPNQTPDPLALALAAIDRYDRGRQDGRTSANLVAERYDVAMLRTAYAQASELRAIRNMLAGAYTLFVAEMEERNDAA